MNNDDLYPSIVFDVAGELFSVNSKHIDGIVQLQDYTRTAGAPKGVRGMMQYRGAAITLYELRAAMDMGSLEDEYDEFCKMIDARKGDHERWVQALEKTAKEHAPFSLATDPHKCALGKWRDAFQCDIDEVNFQLGRLDVPHGALHDSGQQIVDLWAKGDMPGNRAAIIAIYDHVHEVYMPTVLSMLEDLKHVFRSSVFREMVLLVNGFENFGVIVEKIHSVEHLTDLCDAKLINKFTDYSYITGVKRSEKTEGLIANLDIHELVRELNPGGLSLYPGNEHDLTREERERIEAERAAREEL